MSHDSFNLAPSLPTSTSDVLRIIQRVYRAWTESGFPISEASPLVHLNSAISRLDPARPADVGLLVIQLWKREGFDGVMPESQLTSLKVFFHGASFDSLEHAMNRFMSSGWETTQDALGEFETKTVASVVLRCADSAKGQICSFSRFVQIIEDLRSQLTEPDLLGLDLAQLVSAAQDAQNSANPFLALVRKRRPDAEPVYDRRFERGQSELDVAMVKLRREAWKVAATIQVCEQDTW